MKWIVVVAVAALIGLALLAPLGVAHDEDKDKFEVEMAPGPFAPGAEGEIKFTVKDGVLSGKFKAEDLPAQGSHAFYVLWFVRTDTGDKAFLGPIVHKDSILFLNAGDGKLRFSAPHFTTGPNTGSGITLGASGTNFFVLIAENQIDTSMPFPVSPPPSSFALTATV